MERWRHQARSARRSVREEKKESVRNYAPFGRVREERVLVIVCSILYAEGACERSLRSLLESGQLEY